ncbi:hypothetical protein SELMODRAFT_84950 [Selaginella moellendorffii]|uniref:mRNA (guanine-N(7))-methyltransferase n=1 Tax=Selaginella moellendorffii TaxID=88036 RepID=D8R4P3_SELML|nr:mRNA cap guanine-N7 methyltransferase 1 [Selaginella moellendorffii]EFJ33137.1 hypothetical protein SELMODRAFT_84950 [Selaginella moellendorffii]|eukprot:XP_002965717.1 mRNA cap guanine-N7 methyltransferase 1 [Selaginella moellendorffii]
MAFIKEHYDCVARETRDERRKSRVIRLRQLNNMVKQCLLSELIGGAGDHKASNIKVLDLACGRGGDIFKLEGLGVRNYVGVDFSPERIKEAEERARALRSMAAKFVEHDCFSSSLPQDVTAEGPYDACSCQLAIHYAACDEATARTALENISASLKPGGLFVGTTVDSRVVLEKLKRVAGNTELSNSVYKLALKQPVKEELVFGNEYNFALEGVVNDCPEYLVFFDAWEKLAREYGLKLVMHANFKEFAWKHRLGRKMGELTGAEKEVFPLYCVFAFEKLPCMSRNKKLKR